jgi:transposase
MAQSVCLVVSAGDRARLEAIVADRNRPQKQVARARVVLLSADRLDVATVARQAGISRPAVWRWQQRYAEMGVDGLLRDKTRKPGKAPLSEALVRRVVALTCAEPPGEVTYWTGRAMAAAVGVSLRAVQRLWAAHKLRSRIGCAASSARAIPTSSPSSRRSWGSTWPRHGTPWSSRSTRRARSRPSTARSRACPSSPANARR